MAGEVIIDVEKRYPAIAVRANFRLNLAEASTTILFGPSGSGKTTILRAIAGLERPDQGRIQFGEELWFDAGRRIHLPPETRRVGMLFQEYALFPHLTVARNIEFGLDRHTRADRQRIAAEAMALLEIADLAERRPSQISGGQAQRVALARALAPQPRILLLDEPLAALDQPTRVRLRTELRRFLDRIRIPSLLVTHDRTEAIALGHRIVVISEGEVRQTGCVEEVFRRPATAAVAGTVGVETILRGVVVTNQAGLARVRVDGGDILAVTTETLLPDEKVLVCIRAEDVTLQRLPNAQESARNHFTGTIESIESDGTIERISINCGFPLVAIVTRNAREELGLEKGTQVAASAKATAVHLIRV